MNTAKPLILVDGSSYLYRAFHALPSLTNSHGEPTGAIYGVVNMLRRLRKDYDPELMAVVFDPKGKTFRDELFEQYKANRPPMPDELRSQVEPLFALIRALGLPLIVIDGVEADDVIGTFAQQATCAGLRTVISTGDKDMAQLVDARVSLINTMSDTFYDRQGVIKKFGVPPECIIDYLALIGDTSDNIPGVPKVGPKTAVKWLEQYGTLDNIIAHADEIGGKVGENLRACLDAIPLSRQLATIKCDVDTGIGLEQLCIAPADRDALRNLYSRLEFKTWLAEVLGQTKAAPAASQEPVITPASMPDAVSAAKYDIITTPAQLQTWLKRLEKADLFAVDTETTSLDYMQAELVGLSFAVQSGEAAYVPLAHIAEGTPPQLDREATLAQMKALLEDPRQHKLGQNLKYDKNVLANHGINLQGIVHDTMLESYVLDSTASRHDMDSLALKYLSYRTVTFEDIAGKGKDQLRFDQIALEPAAHYAAEDADITLRLHEALWPKLCAHTALRQLYESIEIPLIPVLARMERTGVLIDADKLRAQSGELVARIAEIEQEAYVIADAVFNLGSPKQIQEVLFERQGLPVLQKTPTGQPSTAESVLQELALDYPLPKLILEHRSLAKLKSTYTDKLPEQINPRTGRVHTCYQQAVASTGRLSSTDPNLQNIPIRSLEGRRIRQAFIAPAGYKIVAADYSQIELRIMAHLSGDEGLLRAFAEEADIHRATAAEVFGLDPEQVSNEQRRGAKAINFGLIYGMSAFGLARQLGIDRSAAQNYVDRYFARYPGVKAFMDSTRIQAHERGYVETVFGRRLYLPEINHRNAQRRQYAERTAINAPMQGTAADIIKRAMIAVDGWIQRSGQVRLIMQVHDELVFEVAESAIEQARAQITDLMCQVAELSVPLRVETGVGLNWDEAH